MKSHFTYIMLLISASIALFLLDIAMGSVWIPPSEVWQILTTGTASKSSWVIIVQDFRMPRVMAAVLVGAALAVSGLLMQTLFKNPIAGPYVLGISSGASLGVAVLLLAGGTSIFSSLGQWGLVSASALGAGLVLLLMMAIAWRVRDVVTLLIVGLMLGSATSSIVTILEYFSGLEELKMFVLWSFGSLTRIRWEELQILAMMVGVGLVGVGFLVKPLNALLLGEEYAKSMGLNIMATRFWVIGITALLAGSVTAFCGPIAFLGIATPHLARMLFRTQNHQLLIPTSILMGILLMLFCDLIAQLPGSEQQLPINAVTSLLGAPVVIWIVIRKR